MRVLLRTDSTYGSVYQALSLSTQTFSRPEDFVRLMQKRIIFLLINTGYLSVLKINQFLITTGYLSVLKKNMVDKSRRTLSQSTFETLSIWRKKRISQK